MNSSVALAYTSPIYYVNIATGSTPTLLAPIGGSSNYIYWHGVPETNAGCSGSSAKCNFPWQSSYSVEPAPDKHGQVFYKSSVTSWIGQGSVAFEAYGTNYSCSGTCPPSSGSLSFGAGGDAWDLTESLTSQLAPNGTSGAVSASNLPLIAGELIGDRDCCATSVNYQTFINHAIEFIYQHTATRMSAYGFIHPAVSNVGNITGTCTSSCAATHLSYGDRLVLSAGYNPGCSTSACPVTWSIIYALEKYGMIFGDVQDTTANVSFRWAFASDGSNPWNGVDGGTLNSNLNAITISDFFVVNRSLNGGLICLAGHSGC
jgi:hypothetical protein